jgi:hypothetical protein
MAPEATLYDRIGLGYTLIGSVVPLITTVPMTGRPLGKPQRSGRGL